MLLILIQLCTLPFTELLVVSVHPLALGLNLLGDLLVNLELAVGLPLSLTPLRHKHLPSTDVIHGLVLVREQVPLHQRTVTHGNPAPSCLERALPSDVCQTHLRGWILPILLVLSRQSG